MTANTFDEILEYRYIGFMVPIRQKVFMFGAFLIISLTSCSFNYTEAQSTLEMVPDMVLTDVSAYRYENSELFIQLSAGELEMYDKDKIWAGSNISFVQYDSGDSLLIEAEGSSGLIIVDDDREEYFLGKEVLFHLTREKFFLHASGLKWNKNKNSLSGPMDGVVVIEKEDGSIIQGTGFSADTLGYSYSFNNSVHGMLVTGIEGDSL